MVLIRCTSCQCDKSLCKVSILSLIAADKTKTDKGIIKKVSKYYSYTLHFPSMSSSVLPNSKTAPSILLEIASEKTKMANETI